jgi:alpha-tubulin suppressor-like RCC1 family protein
MVIPRTNNQSTSKHDHESVVNNDRNTFAQAINHAEEEINITHIATGYNHAVVLRSNGRVIAWGENDESQTAVPAGLEGIQQIAAGYAHTVVLYPSGLVGSWGRNIGSPPLGVNNVIRVAAGCWHTVVLKKDGTVLAWGLNDEDQCTVPQFTNPPIDIAAGYFHTVVCHEDGHVSAWGRNNDGQANVPDTLHGVIAVAASINHTVALCANGTVVAWGANQYGQCDIPADITTVTQIAAGDGFTLALLNDGRVMGWGNIFIPRGIGVIARIVAGHSYVIAVTHDYRVIAWSQDSYEEYSGDSEWLKRIEHVVAGLCHTVAIRADGTVIAWGKNTFQQCDVPPHINNVKQIALGLEHTLALMHDGTVVAWGRNTEAQSTVPVGLAHVVQIAAGHLHSVALCADGTVVTWGDNTHGQCDIPMGVTNAQKIIAGVYNTAAYLRDGAVVVWGNNDYNQCVVPTWNGTIIDVQLNHGYDITYFVAWTDKNDVVMWGNNDYGQCDIPGDDIIIRQLSAGERHVVAICNDETLIAWGDDMMHDGIPIDACQKVEARRDHTLALTQQNSVQSWGFNIHGLLDVPVWLRNIKDIDAGIDYSIALDNTSTMVTWRTNRVVDVDRLVQVGNSTTLTYFHPFTYKSGGEARLYSADGKMLKKYTQVDVMSSDKKLRYLIDHPVNYTINQRPLVIWPQELAYHPFHGHVIGYVMPFVDAVPIVEAYRHDQRIAFWPHLQNNVEEEHRFLYRIARESANVLAHIHEKGYVVGDLNPKNIMVYKDGTTVAFIDCDSFQVGNGSKYGCRMGVEDYLDPDVWQKIQPNQPIPYDVYSDAFALAVIFFRLFCNDMHPYQGITLSKGSELSEAYQKRKQEYPHLQSIPAAVEPHLYCQRKRVWPYDPTLLWPHSKTLKICVPTPLMQQFYPELPALLRALFLRAFTGNREQRPTPAEWMHTFDMLLAQS